MRFTVDGQRVTLREIVLSVGSNIEIQNVKNGLRPNATIDEQRSSAHMMMNDVMERSENKASSTYSLELLEACIAQEDNIDEIIDGDGAAIHIGSTFHDTSILNLLIKAGANVNLLDSGKNSPLNYAMLTDAATALTLLLKHGAKPQLVRDGERASDIATAIGNDNVRCVEVLLAHLNTPRERIVVFHQHAIKIEAVEVRIYLEKLLNARNVAA